MIGKQDYENVMRPWNRTEFERKKLRPYYQEMLSGELNWQDRNPADISEGPTTYTKPGFSENLIASGDPNDPYTYYDINPKDEVEKPHSTLKERRMSLDDPSKYGKAN